MLAETEINNSIKNSDQAADPSLTEELHVQCIHCGQLLISSKDRRSGFCCSGCKAVYEFINNLGLDYFYCLREKSEEWKSVPAAASNSTFKYFDDDNFRNDFIEKEKESGLSLMELQLSGLHCSACIWLLEKLSEVLPGLIEVRVNILSSKARIKFDSKKLKPSVIAATIQGMGYQVRPLNDAVNSDRVVSILGGDKQLAIQLGVAGFCAMNVMLLFIGRYQGIFSGIEQQYSNFFAWFSLLLAVPAVLYSAKPFYQTSYAAIKMGRLHIDLPISLAIVAGFSASCINTILGRPEIYFDTVTALVFLLLCGRWCQRKALNYASDFSNTLYTYAPLSAFVMNNQGRFEEKFSASIAAADRVLVKHSEVFPCDGEVLKGSGFVNNSFLNGESKPQEVHAGSLVWAGSINEGDDLLVTANGCLKSSRFGKLLSNIQNISINESKTSRFVDRLSKYFVFGVLFLSCLTLILYAGGGFWDAWDRVIALLVVSCPCALGIATPVTLSLANAAAARRGIIFRSPRALENLSEVKKVFFDKTGTLTNGKLGLAEAKLMLEGANWKDVWNIVVTLESDSRQPAGAGLFNAAKANGGEYLVLNEIEQIEGRGIRGKSSDGHIYRIGSLRWLKNENVNLTDSGLIFPVGSNNSGYSIVGLAKDNCLIARFSLKDTIRFESSNVITKLNFRGIECGILSGDRREVVEEVAAKLNVGTGYKNFELLPEEKAEIIQEAGPNTAFVGDGVNDALALNKSSVGIAIGGGAEISMKTADIFLAKPNLMLVIEAIDGAKKTLSLIKRHLAISLFYNLTAGSLAILGLIGPLAAALVMPASSLTVILSSLASVPFKRGK